MDTAMLGAMAASATAGIGFAVAVVKAWDRRGARKARVSAAEATADAEVDVVAIGALRDVIRAQNKVITEFGHRLDAERELATKRIEVITAESRAAVHTMRTELAKCESGRAVDAVRLAALETRIEDLLRVRRSVPV